MFNVQVIGSSSKGNSYIIRTSEEILLLECGVTYKQLAKALDYDFTKVVGCLVSHEHKDHSRSVKEFAEKGIDIFMSTGTMKGIDIQSPRVTLLEPLQQFRLGKFTVLPFGVKHDAIEPLGFLIHHKEFGKLLFATDTYYIEYKFKGLNYLMIECNYSKEILDRNVGKGFIHKKQKRRLLTSHFSLGNVKKFLYANDLSKVEEIYLIHLSDGNSNASQFVEEIQGITGIPTKVC